MVSTIIQATTYLFIGFIEMFLATARTSLIAKGRNLSASIIVFIENLLYFFILYQLINQIERNIPVLISYSLGGSLGTFVNLKKSS
ncbi:MAG: hypothetical protein KatS3mg088_101 [Patescibacteria group bacterium]|nr:MAG: hypothetical protein KatS3mg088_101 [Patescibacteria group bacterium]